MESCGQRSSPGLVRGERQAGLTTDVRRRAAPYHVVKEVARYTDRRTGRRSYMYYGYPAYWNPYGYAPAYFGYNPFVPYYGWRPLYWVP
jgi:hypothetical protein